VANSSEAHSSKFLKEKDTEPDCELPQDVSLPDEVYGDGSLFESCEQVPMVSSSNAPDIRTDNSSQTGANLYQVAVASMMKSDYVPGNNFPNFSNEPCIACIPQDPDAAGGAVGLVTRSTPQSEVLTQQLVVPNDLGQRILDYLRSSESEGCRKIFRDGSSELMAATQALRTGELSLSSRHLDIVSKYLDECFSFADGEIGEKVGEIEDVVGLFRPQDGKLCHGIINRGFLITAAHCFAVHELSRNQPAQFAIPSEIKFLTLYGDERQLHLCDTNCALNWPKWSNNLDILKLSIQNWNEIEGSIRTEFDIKNPQKGEQLLLASYHPLEVLLANIQGRPARVTISADPLCAAADVKDDIIVNGCQTGPGMSGVPIFSWVNGQPSFVGIHAGSTEELPSSLGHWFPTFVNYAVSSAVTAR
jgi:hypothetical protein